ncbi:MAG: hypothetical protein U9Q81_04920 [Pseudomonadota bacterium]|nr:hypothetical protein [Pseudomonadota bacterium]
MSELNTRDQLSIGLALAAVMAFTRGQHIAALGHHLPDATLAVFFLAGLYLRPGWVFPALFAHALLIDVAAVGWGGVSSFCISPAYGFLVPAYGAMWFAGRWYAGCHRFSWSMLAPLSASLLGAAVVAELLASGGFYVFSGRFSNSSILGLGSRLVAYFPTTLAAVALYAVIAAALHSAVVCTRQSREGSPTTG